MRLYFNQPQNIRTAIALSTIITLTLAYQTDDVRGRGAVVANGPECAEIGISILAKGGSAVDAAIATLFCEGVTCPQSMGLGGGFVATIYTKREQRFDSLVARETASRHAHIDMFENTTKIIGGIAVAVPGELKGYWALHQKYGRLAWHILVQPSIDLASKGHIATAHLANALQLNKEAITNETNYFGDAFINKNTGELVKAGDLIKQTDLAKTLKVIAEQGEDAIYNGGKIGKILVEDIKAMNGIVDEEDLRSYKVRWGKPLKAPVDDKHTMYTVPLPGSGVVLSFILNLLYRMPTEDRLVFHQRLVESFKHGYGQRANLGDSIFARSNISDLLQDPDFIDSIRNTIIDDQTSSDPSDYGAYFSNVEDHGTANIAVLAPNGDAIVVTSTINTYFGAKFRSRTGIILNDEMDDFSIPGRPNGFGIPPSPANFIAPGKMPMSSMCPAIIVDDDGNVRLLVGAAGGSKITSSVASIILNYMILNESLNDAVQNPRLHHQLVPMRVLYEKNFDPIIIEYLESIGHIAAESSVRDGFSAATAIGLLNNELVAVYDHRRNGSAKIMTAEHFD